VNNSKYTNTYTIYGSGDVVVAAAIEPARDGLPDLPPIRNANGDVPEFG